MRKDFSWATNVKYSILYNDNTVDTFSNQSCYSKFSPDFFKNGQLLTLFNLKMVKTKQYYKKYLWYIAEMLELENVTIGEDHFSYKPFTCPYKNMLVCSLTRFLWEKIGTKEPIIQMQDVFFKPLFDNIKYEDKLEQFCHTYRNMEVDESYWHIGHSWAPSGTRIKSTKDWLELPEYINSVNGFFEI